MKINAQNCKIEKKVELFISVISTILCKLYIMDCIDIDILLQLMCKIIISNYYFQNNNLFLC